MKYTEKIKKKVVRGAVLLLGTVLFTTAVGANTGTLNGQFTINENQQISETKLQNSLKITKADDSEVTGEKLIPNTNYKIKFNIEDLDGFYTADDEKLSLKVALFAYSDDGGTATLPDDKQLVKDKFDGLTGVNASGNQLLFNWDFNKSTAAEPVLVGAETYTTSSWKLGTSTSAEGFKPTVTSVQTVTDFEFVFPFTVSKVASTKASWYVAVSANDKNGSEVFVTKAIDGIQWYGEIANLSESPVVDFGNVKKDNSGKRVFLENKTTTTLKTITNGPNKYDFKANSATWSDDTDPDNVLNATLVDFSSVPDSNLPAQQFSMKVINGGSLYTNARYLLASSTATMLGDTSKSPEEGKNHSFDFYLQASDDFTPGTYKGVINATLSNSN